MKYPTLFIYGFHQQLHQVFFYERNSSTRVSRNSYRYSSRESLINSQCDSFGIPFSNFFRNTSGVSSEIHPGLLRSSFRSYSKAFIYFFPGFLRKFLKGFHQQFLQVFFWNFNRNSCRYSSKAYFKNSFKDCTRNTCGTSARDSSRISSGNSSWTRTVFLSRCFPGVPSKLHLGISPEITSIPLECS